MSLVFQNLTIIDIFKPVLSRKREAILFLFTLSSSNMRQPPPIQMPTLVYTQQSNAHIEPVAVAPSAFGEKGRSHAELLKDFRAKKGSSNIIFPV